MDRDEQTQADSSSDIIGRMIKLIASQKDAYFKSQQRDETDLNDDQKRTIVQNLFDTNKTIFLHHYGKYLDKDDLQNLESLWTDEKSDLYIQIKDLKERCRHKQSAIKNRRYQALQKLLRDGSYFSNSEMQSRNPYLFEQMIGQYMSSDERKRLQNSCYELNYNNTNFSSFLMEQIRNIHLKCKYMVDENIEGQEEVEDEDESEEDNDEPEQLNSNVCKISNENKKVLEKEFRDQMIENFLSGKDSEFFDYKTVDENEDYDMSEEFERDQEDKYFAEEE
ncbi:hypothetical protein RDWZM_008959 [Blomia tropicalis]|uniref:CCD97-like C-terminal domain-containing protein n=1 Tax=Blomia tropicalis TaxID=40697 RepID=A0A9Q0M5H4_BLOTA|nr:Molybdenum cofactor synthesis protein 3 [Blomia tropicalis]KAJ6217802.1 hypothetical protein RDWZM_008959 [Blomia tropicalis]